MGGKSSQINQKNRGLTELIKKTIKCLGARLLTKLGIIDRYEARQKSVLILMYHRVNANPDCLGLTITPELFSQQLHYIKEHYDVISLSEAVTQISSQNVQSNRCVITFDDGYRDNYEVAAPLLTEHNMPATIFITYDAIQNGHFGWGEFDRALLTTARDFLDLQHFGLGQYPLVNSVERDFAVTTLHRLLKQRPDSEKLAVMEYVVAGYGGGGGTDGVRTMMNWEEVIKLASVGLVTIGAHTISHPILSRVPLAQARREVVEGKRLIEQSLGRSVHHFAYPNGQPSDIGHAVVEMIKPAGYQSACTTIEGLNPVGSDPFYLRRINVTSYMSTDSRGNFSPELFATMISGLLYKK